jgi:solute carrier family 35 (UDP-sugar transporter), member A1/2/3
VYVHSGFAGIYFEKVLKGSTVSIWIRNVQMGSVGAIAAILTACATDGAAIARDGFFQGWDALVAGVAAQVGLGGLLTALCVRFADNILKGFATSISIVLSGVLSMYMIPALKFSPGPEWILGSSLVMLATFMYSAFD